ncbi:hypothetical protein LSAT2_005326, partial [Lamellibrachia satsuma]
IPDVEDLVVACGSFTQSRRVAARMAAIQKLQVGYWRTNMLQRVVTDRTCGVTTINV